MKAPLRVLTFTASPPKAKVSAFVEKCARLEAEKPGAARVIEGLVSDLIGVPFKLGGAR